MLSRLVGTVLRLGQSSPREHSRPHEPPYVGELFMREHIGEQTDRYFARVIQTVRQSTSRLLLHWLALKYLDGLQLASNEAMTRKGSQVQVLYGPPFFPSNCKGFRFFNSPFWCARPLCKQPCKQRAVNRAK